MTEKTKRLFKGALISLLALCIGVSLCAYLMLKFSLPTTDGKVTISGIGESVEITFDSLGIPQIWAGNNHDAYFALGWQHGADRLFQLDLLRRVSQGRLSEMLGERTVEFDKRQRRVGHHRIATAALDNLSETNRALLQAYADGINAYKEHCATMPFEFYLLPISFDQWTVYDCLTILSFQTWFSDALQNHDSRDLAISQMHNADLSRLMIHPYPDSGLSTIQSDDRTGDADISVINQLKEFFSLRETIQSRLADEVMRHDAKSYTATTSSNAWVVAPERSESGFAMMASDPHLELTRLPQFWYAVGLHIADENIDAVGVTVPGMPFVIMGHNKSSAWSFTAGGVDVTDFFEEIVDTEDSSRYMIHFGEQPTDKIGSDDSNGENEWRSFDVYVDTINVVGADYPSVMTTKVTRHGPVVTRSEAFERVRTLFWAGYDADLNRAVTAGFDLARMNTFEQFQNAVTNMGALNANWMYADKSGTIGYQLGTPVPIRPDSWNGGVLPGWTSEHEWAGYLPISETPTLTNPQRGWLANCNNRPSAKHDIPGNYSPDRIMRITHLLDSLEKFSAEHMHAFQLDQTDAYLLEWRDLLVPLITEQDSAIARQLSEWDGDCSVSSTTTSILLALVDKLKTLTFDELGENASDASRYALGNIMSNGPDSLFDRQSTPEFESSKDLVAKAIELIHGQDHSEAWGEKQSLTMSHPMAVVPTVGWLLGLKHGPWSNGGTAGTLNSSFGRKRDNGRFATIVGPSMRTVVDFADVDAATLVLPAGNSGNPMSDHFFDFNSMWREGRTWAVPITRDEVEERAMSTLTLRPNTNQ